jgi:branched-subunit amino acid transport protein
MSTPWAIVLVMAVATTIVKSSGPLLLGGRAVPAPLERVIELTVPVMLAAVIVHQTLTSNGDYALDARAVGLCAAAAAMLARLPVLVVLFVAAASTAAARAVA